MCRSSTWKRKRTYGNRSCASSTSCTTAAIQTLSLSMEHSSITLAMSSCVWSIWIVGKFTSATGLIKLIRASSLDRISKNFGPVRVDVLGKITEAILNGLNYLYDVHRIMHRDIKPSNVLVSSRGHIKLCDFGVSGELVNSIADTFVGTSTYMAPERIQGAKYSIKSDVWSVGLTIMELAIGKFPFDASDAQAEEGYTAPGGILDLLQQIVHEPAPVLPKADAFPPILDQMIQKCLLKNPDDRPTPKLLYVCNAHCIENREFVLTVKQEKDHFVAAAKRTPVNLQEWAIGLMERENRKSHLAPQLSPSTQALLRGDSTSSPSKESSASSVSRTPTSGEIPIGGEAMKPSPSTDTNSINTPLNSAGSRIKTPDTNGSSTYSSKSLGLERPFPPRTSSNSLLPGRTRESPSSSTAAVAAQIRSPGYNPAIPPSRGKENDGFSLPIRPAPPPSGPLPTPPGSSFKQTVSRRQGNGLSSNSEATQF